MEDSLIVTYDNCPPDVSTLIVARKDKYDMTILKKIQGDEAFGIYHFLTGGAELMSTRDISKKIKKKSRITMHLHPRFIYTYHCPNCDHLIHEYEEDGVNPKTRNNYCNVCGQALDWK